MKNPLPEPSRGAPGSSAMSRRQRGPDRERLSPRTAASTLTTAALTRAATAAKSRGPGVDRGRRPALQRVTTSGVESCGFSAVPGAAGLEPPAAITSPIRKPTTPVSAANAPATRFMDLWISL